MKQLILFAALSATLVTGCASQHKLTQPSGRWQPINQAGFVPASAERFYKSVIEQAKAEATAEAQQMIQSTDFQTNTAIAAVDTAVEASEFGQLDQTQPTE